MKFLLRNEARATERRAPITPKDAKTLMAAGGELLVESSAKRIFPDANYADAGCRIVPSGTWETAENVTILGLKELPETPAKLALPFIHFAHIFKDQSGWQDELRRFTNGGGCLYDLEYLTIQGRRTAAFGYWAGWMGATLAAWRLLARWNGNDGPLKGVSSFESRSEVEDILRAEASACIKPRRAVVIGAKGRSGRGAIEALKLAGFEISAWDIEETRQLSLVDLMAHDLLVNCVLMTGPGMMLLRPEDIANPQNYLQMISDVSCDPFSDFNPLPVYSQPTEWDAPFVQLGQNGIRETLELTAIDNLPSLLPREASEDFSAQLLASLLCYPDGAEWQAARTAFEAAVKRLNG